MNHLVIFGDCSFSLPLPLPSFLLSLPSSLLLSLLPFFFFLSCFWDFETGFLSVTALSCSGIPFVDQTGLKLTEIHLLPKCWDQSPVLPLPGWLPFVISFLTFSLLPLVCLLLIAL